MMVMGMLKKLIKMIDYTLTEVDWDMNDYPDTDKLAEILIAKGVTIPVQCKDCKWAEYGKDYEPYCNHWKSGLYANIKDNDFCSYGERIEA